MRRIRVIIGLVCAFVLAGCEQENNVPSYPVHAVIDTRTGAFVHFQSTALNSYVLITRDGYFLNGVFAQATSAMDAWGYGGLLCFVSINGYDAYDLACPYCAKLGRRQPCDIDGMFAICPHCGEQYDLTSGTAAPQKGLAREPMKRLNIQNADGKLTLSQR